MQKKTALALAAAALGAVLTACGATTPDAQSVAVNVSPNPATLSVNGTQQFTATVQGDATSSVTWAVTEGSAGGTVSGTGLYTAPATAGTYHVVATSTLDTTKSASAQVTVNGGGSCTDTDAAFCARVGKTCGTLSGTDACGQSRTATCGPACPVGAKQSWVWIYMNMKANLQSVIAHPGTITHVSPTFYTVNYDYQSGVAYYSTCPPNYRICSGNSTGFADITTKAFTDMAHGAGLKVVPALYGGAGNEGTDQGIINLLDNVNGAQDAFISAMTAEAVANGYDGYNIDWETAGLGNAYADKFVAFVNKWKAALAPHNMSLSLDVIVSDIHGTWCSGNNGIYDFAKLSASAVDAIIIEDYVNTLGTATTSCQSRVLNPSNPIACEFNFTGELNYMCSNLPMDKAIIGLYATSGGTNPIAGDAFATLESYGFTGVAVWAQEPFMDATSIQPSNATWWSLLQSFLGN